MGMETAVRRAAMDTAGDTTGQIPGLRMKVAQMDFPETAMVRRDPAKAVPRTANVRTQCIPLSPRAMDGIGYPMVHLTRITANGCPSIGTLRIIQSTQAISIRLLRA